MRDAIKLLLKVAWGFLTNLLHLRSWRGYRTGDPRHAPIFIVGCGHSGTSLLLSILGAHSSLFAIPEETAFAYDYGLEKPRLRKSAAWFLWYLDSRAIRAGKKRWVEKTPRHILAIALLLTLRPHAKFIIIIRDGRDVAASLAKRHKTVREGIERWVYDNRAGEPFWKHPQVYKIRYEDLIADFETTMRGILQFLGEDYEEQLSCYHQTPRLYYAKSIEKPPDESDAYHKEYRNWQINQPIFDGRGKWEKLSAEEKATIKEIGGEMLIEYGYVQDLNW